MSSNPFDSSGDFGGFDGPPKQPPKLLTFLGLSSVLGGVLVGIYGVSESLAGSTNTSQFLFGGIGYLLTAIIPIVLLQIVRTKHTSALSNNKEVAYDIYAGMKQQTFFLKIVAIGLLVTVLPIFTLFLPIAEKFSP